MLLIHIARWPETLKVSGVLWLFGLVHYLGLTVANSYLAVWFPGKYSFGQKLRTELIFPLVDLFIRCLVADQ